MVKIESQVEIEFLKSHKAIFSKPLNTLESEFIIFETNKWTLAKKAGLATKHESRALESHHHQANPTIKMMFHGVVMERRKGRKNIKK